MRQTVFFSDLQDMLASRSIPGDRPWNYHSSQRVAYVVYDHVKSISVLLVACLIAGMGGLLQPEISRAESVVTEVAGTFNGSQENGCLRVSLFYYRVDCSYHRSQRSIDGVEIPWVGPTVNPVYYAPRTPETALTYVPALHDARIKPSLRGTLRVDQQGTANLDDDEISGTLVVGPAARSLVTRASGHEKRLRAIETWRQITHTLPPTHVTAARRTPQGGVEYSIASQGMPTRLCLKADEHDCFPSARAAETTDGKWGAATWATPGNLPVGRSITLGGNIGAQTMAVIDGYECFDNTAGAECARGVGVWGSTAEDPGLDNLLLRVETDADGRVIAASGFWTQEYRVGVGPPSMQSPPGEDDSWLGGYLELKPASKN